MNTNFDKLSFLERLYSSALGFLFLLIGGGLAIEEPDSTEFLYNSAAPWLAVIFGLVAVFFLISAAMAVRIRISRLMISQSGLEVIWQQQHRHLMKEIRQSSTPPRVAKDEKLSADDDNELAQPFIDDERAETCLEEKTLDGKVYIYNELEQIPLAILKILIDKWPEEGEEGVEKPYDFRDFSYATRKKGRGIHAWFLKFNNLGGFWVSYGRGGKTNVYPDLVTS